MAQWLRALTADLKINGSNPDVVKEMFLSKIVSSNIFLSYIQINSFIKHIFIIYTNHSLTYISHFHL